MKKIWVIIPAYNEGKSLQVMLEGVKRKNIPLLVIDDGSTDDTYESAAKVADEVIRSKKNLGKGNSLKKGIEYLLNNKEFDYLVTMDADGQHSADDLDKFIQISEKSPDIVVGNRMSNPFGMPRIRMWTNKLMSWFISFIIGQKIPDTQCGFRLIKKEVLEKIRIKTKKFETDSEILIKAARAGFVIENLPVKSIYPLDSHSKINPFVDTIRFLRFLFWLAR
ncbi:MAG: glycosyltransferase [Candidatus Omnitrophica bacterium]|nr:glycosyltransferase [Candidatus Omnitrophota bacterium]MBD3268765.1 glycosyltransferase [Candidatus Omnitrophota bacterium]